MKTLNRSKSFAYLASSEPCLERFTQDGAFFDYEGYELVRGEDGVFGYPEGFVRPEPEPLGEPEVDTVGEVVTVDETGEGTGEEDLPPATNEGGESSGDEAPTENYESMHWKTLQSLVVNNGGEWTDKEAGIEFLNGLDEVVA